MRFAYADPPYYGCGRLHYGKHHPEAAKWDDKDTHLELIDELRSRYDGAALSCLPRDLSWLLPACPRSALVAAWVKPFGSGFKPGMRHIRAWEPVIYWTPRMTAAGPGRDEGAGEVRDVLTANATSGRGLVGVKPRAFNRWVIELLGVTNTDTLHDLFPGKGGMDAELAQLVLL